MGFLDGSPGGSLRGLRRQLQKGVQVPGQPAPLSNQFITFDVEALEAFDPAPPPLGTPSTILTTAQQWELRATFKFAESAANWLVSLSIPWTLTVKAESFGPEPEVTLPPVSGTTVANQTQYGPAPPGTNVPTVVVPAGSLVPAVYRMVGIVTFGGAPPAPIVGYNSDLVVQIYA
jgi:hypothetical protein